MFPHTMNYPKKTGLNLYQSRHCAYITYSMKTWFLKNLSVEDYDTFLTRFSSSFFFKGKKVKYLSHLYINCFLLLLYLQVL